MFIWTCFLSLPEQEIKCALIRKREQDTDVWISGKYQLIIRGPPNFWKRNTLFWVRQLFKINGYALSPHSHTKNSRYPIHIKLVREVRFKLMNPSVNGLISTFIVLKSAEKTLENFIDLFEAKIYTRKKTYLNISNYQKEDFLIFIKRLIIFRQVILISKKDDLKPYLAKYRKICPDWDYLMKFITIIKSRKLINL